MLIDGICRGWSWLGSEPMLLLGPGWNTNFESHSKAQLPTTVLYIITVKKNQEMTVERQSDLLRQSYSLRESLIASPWEAPRHSKPPLTSPHWLAGESILSTVTIPQRAKIWLYIFFSPVGSCFGTDPISLFSKEHSGFSVFRNLFDYNHKGKDCEAPVLVPRKTLTGQKTCPTAKLSCNDCTFYFSQERVI